MHRIGVIAVPPVTAFDLSVPELVFAAVQADDGPAYEVIVCTPQPGIVATTGGVSIVVEHGLSALREADTVIVTGSGRRQDFDPRILATGSFASALTGHGNCSSRRRCRWTRFPGMPASGRPSRCASTSPGASA